MQTVTYLDEPTTSKSRAIAAEVHNRVKHLTESSGRLSGSLLYSEVVKNALVMDELGEIEEEVDEQLVEEVGYTLERIDREKFSDDEVIRPHRDDHLSRGRYREMNTVDVDMRLPTRFWDKLREASERITGGPRGQSYLLTRWTKAMLDSPFDSRYRRLRTKEQLLAIARGHDIDDPTRFVQRRLNKELREGENHELRAFESIFEEVDWSSVKIDGDFELPRRAVKNQYVPQGHPRKKALACVMRYENAPAARDDLITIAQDIFPDVSEETHEGYAEAVIDATDSRTPVFELVQEEHNYDIDDFDATRQVVEKRFKPIVEEVWEKMQTGDWATGGQEWVDETQQVHDAMQQVTSIAPEGEEWPEIRLRNMAKAELKQHR